MSEIQVGQINSTDGSTAITTGADGYVSFAKTQIGGRRNLIINGAMQVAQRGTSFTVNGLGVYTIDRFNLDESTDGSLTVSQSTETPDGFKYSMKITPASADTSIGSSQYARLKYFMEGYDVNNLAFGTTSAKDLTLSFYAKTNKTGTYCFSLDLLGGSERTYINEVSLSNTWTRYTLSIPKNTSQAFANSTNGKSSELELILAAGSSFNGTAGDWTNTNFSTSNQVNFMDDTANELYITGVQLEVGPLATPFEHRSYGEELALCQRYFYKYASSSQLIAYGTSRGGTRIFTTYTPQAMRAAPTFSGSPTLSVDGGSYNSVTISAVYAGANSNLISLGMAGGGYDQDAVLAVVDCAYDAEL